MHTDAWHGTRARHFKLSPGNNQHINILKNVCKSVGKGTFIWFFSHLFLEYSYSSVHIMFQYLFKNKITHFHTAVWKICRTWQMYSRVLKFVINCGWKKLPQTTAYIFRVKYLFSNKNHKIVTIKIQNNLKKHTKHKSLLLKKTKTFRSIEWRKRLKKNLMLQGWVPGNSQQTF